MGALTSENKLAINRMVNHITPALSFVYSRWVDKAALEGIEEYARIIEEELPDGFSLLRMTKTPFGFRLKFTDIPNYFLIVTINSQKIMWKSVSFRSFT